MSRTTFEQAVGLLGSLSPAELEQLSAKAAALRALASPAAPSPPGAAGPGCAACDPAFEALLYRALSEALEHETGTRQQAHATFIRTRTGAAFCRAAAAAGAVHAQWFPQASRAQSAALARIYARCVLNWLEGRKEPFQWPRIAHALAGLPEVLSAAFPGYARAGALSMLLSARPDMVGAEGPDE